MRSVKSQSPPLQLHLWTWHAFVFFKFSSELLFFSHIRVWRKQKLKLLNYWREIKYIYAFHGHRFDIWSVKFETWLTTRFNCRITVENKTTHCSAVTTWRNQYYAILSVLFLMYANLAIDNLSFSFVIVCYRHRSVLHVGRHVQENRLDITQRLDSYNILICCSRKEHVWPMFLNKCMESEGEKQISFHL